jgi:hypothetical protein
MPVSSVRIADAGRGAEAELEEQVGEGGLIGLVDLQ